MTEPGNGVANVPPPWRLSGSATVLIFRFSEGYVYDRVRLPPALSGMFVGGLGAVMLVDYAESPVGPYRELAFSPGQFAYGRNKAHSVTHIYVSTQASADNGRANWGLPKLLAAFEVAHDGDVHHWTVRREGQLVYELRFRPGRLTVPFPGWLYRPRIVQPWQDGLLLTRFKVSGRAQLADVETPRTGGDFPDIGKARPIGVVHLPRFKLTFPPPRSVAR
jgi:hypothetical protein